MMTVGILKIQMPHTEICGTEPSFQVYKNKQQCIYLSSIVLKIVL